MCTGHVIDQIRSWLCVGWGRDIHGWLCVGQREEMAVLLIVGWFCFHVIGRVTVFA